MGEAIALAYWSHHINKLDSVTFDTLLGNQDPFVDPSPLFDLCVVNC